MRIRDRSKDVIKSGGEWISSVTLGERAHGPPGGARGGGLRGAAPQVGRAPHRRRRLKKGMGPAKTSSRAPGGRFAKFWLPDAFVFVDADPAHFDRQVPEDQAPGVLRGAPRRRAVTAPPAARRGVRDCRHVRAFDRAPGRRALREPGDLSQRRDRREDTRLGRATGRSPGGFSEGKSYKIKRLRNNPKVRVAAYVRGRVRGTWLEGSARILDDEARIALAHQALRRKYGFQAAVTDFFAWLAGRTARRAYIEVTL